MQENVCEIPKSIHADSGRQTDPSCTSCRLWGDFGDILSALMRECSRFLAQTQQTLRSSHFRQFLKRECRQFLAKTPLRYGILLIRACPFHSKLLVTPRVVALADVSGVSLRDINQHCYILHLCQPPTMIIHYVPTHELFMLG